MAISVFEESLEATREEMPSIFRLIDTIRSRCPHFRVAAPIVHMRASKHSTLSTTIQPSEDLSLKGTTKAGGNVEADAEAEGKIGVGNEKDREPCTNNETEIEAENDSEDDEHGHQHGKGKESSSSVTRRQIAMRICSYASRVLRRDEQSFLVAQCATLFLDDAPRAQECLLKAARTTTNLAPIRTLYDTLRFLNPAIDTHDFRLQMQQIADSQTAALSSQSAKNRFRVLLAS